MKPNGLRLKSTKKLKTMTLRECGKHVLMELCKNTGRAWIKKSNGSTDHTQNCPMCGITYEERVNKRGGPQIEGSHVGVDFQPMLNHAFEQVFMTHQCDELTNSEILQKVMSIFHDLHNLAVNNQSCAIQPSCKSCNWYLGKCSVKEVDILKNNPQAWGKHVLYLKGLKNTYSQPIITSMLQSQDSSDEESSDSLQLDITGQFEAASIIGRRENKQENESSDEESSLKRPRGSVDTDSCESRPSTSESKRQRRVNTRPDYRNNGVNLANAKRETLKQIIIHVGQLPETVQEWYNKCCRHDSCPPNKSDNPSMTVNQVLKSYKEWLKNHKSPTKGVRPVFLGTLKKIGHPIRMNDTRENNKSLIDNLKFKR